MNRHEFLKQLEHALEAEMNPAKVREHVDYYRSYIAEEVKNGKSEKEVMDLLGDPWVIARSIIDSPLNETEINTHMPIMKRQSRRHHLEHRR